MLNNGAQFVGLTPRPIKYKNNICDLHLWQTRIYLRFALSEISISYNFDLLQFIIKYRFIFSEIL